MPKKPVTVPRFSFNAEPPPVASPREIAEEHIVQAIKDSVDIIDFYLTELWQTPNPTKSFRNRVNQRALTRALAMLCCTTIPPIELPATQIKPKQPRVKMRGPTNVCVSCGGPARIAHNSEWFCQDCSPEESAYKRSEIRREHARQIREMEHEAIMMGNAIKSVERAVTRVERYSRHSQQAAGNLETSGREENNSGGSETAHQPSARDLGDAES